MSLDDLFSGEEGDARHESRGRMAAQTFGVAVVAVVLCVTLAGLLLYAFGVGAAALWAYWTDGPG